MVSVSNRRDSRSIKKSLFFAIVPYPFLTANTLPVRVGIYFGAALLAFGSFMIINGLHRHL